MLGSSGKLWCWSVRDCGWVCCCRVGWGEAGCNGVAAWDEVRRSLARTESGAVGWGCRVGLGRARWEAGWVGWAGQWLCGAEWGGLEGTVGWSGVG